MSTVTLEFKGSPITIGISRKATCDDVIEYLTKAEKQDGEVYEMIEMSCGVGRKIGGRTKVMKVVRSWASLKNKCNFVVKKKLDVNNEMNSIAKSNNKLQQLKYTLKQLKNNVTMTNNLENMFETKDDVYSKDKFKNLGKVKNAERGKMALMSRFIKDAMTFKSGPFYEDESVLHARTCGDGASDVTGTDGGIVMDSSATSMKMDVGETSEMDRAFVEDSDKDFVDLDQCIIEEDSLDESAFDEESDCDSISSLERNIVSESTDEFDVRNEVVRQLFDNIDTETEDSDIESFMNTVIKVTCENTDCDRDSYSDEGLSSLASDDLSLL